MGASHAGNHLPRTYTFLKTTETKEQSFTLKYRAVERFQDSMTIEINDSTCICREKHTHVHITTSSGR